MVRAPSLPRAFVAETTFALFAFLLGVWFLTETGWLPQLFYAVAYPVWLPVYVALAVASGLRNAVFAWLGTGLSFDAVVALGLYFQAVLFVAVGRTLRRVVRTYRRGGSAERTP